MGLWEKTKDWASNNRVVAGALAGGTVGSVVPGLGTVIGVVVGAGVGYLSSKERDNNAVPLELGPNKAGDKGSHVIPVLPDEPLPPDEHGNRILNKGPLQTT